MKNYFFRELDPILEHRTQFTFKSQRKNIPKVNIKNNTYPNQHINMVQEIKLLGQIPIHFILRLSQQIKYIESLKM